MNEIMLVVPCRSQETKRYHHFPTINIKAAKINRSQRVSD